jgi:hypothetical protein
MNIGNYKETFYTLTDFISHNLKEEALKNYKELKNLKFYTKIDIKKIEKEYSTSGVYSILYRFYQSQ